MLKVVTNLKFKHYGNGYIQNRHTFREKIGPHSSLPEPYLNTASSGSSHDIYGILWAPREEKRKAIATPSKIAFPFLLNLHSTTRAEGLGSRLDIVGMYLLYGRLIRD